MEKIEKFLEFFFEKIKNKNILIFLLFLFITSIIYSPSFTNLNFFWDDERFVFGNPTFMQAPYWYSFWDIKSDFYKSWPLGYSIFWILIKKFSISTIVFFKTLNILVHALNSFLVLHFLRKINLKYAFMCTFIFLVHPLNVETISWIFQLLTLASFFFFIISLIFFQNYLSTNKLYFSILSLIFFLFSLWTKSIALLSPFLFLTLIWVAKGNLKKYLVVIPFFLLSLFLGVTNLKGTSSLTQPNNNNAQIRMSFFNVFDEGIQTIIPHNSGKVIKDSSTEYFDSIYNRKPKSEKIEFNRKEIFKQGVWHYFSKIIFPLNLNYIYPTINTPIIFILLPILALLIIPFYYALKKRKRILILIPALSITLLAPYLGVTFITFFLLVSCIR